MHTRYALTVLGPARLRRVDGLDGDAATRITHRPKQFAVLTYLALAPGNSCSREALLALLWPASEPARAKNALSQTLTRIRGALGDGILSTGSMNEAGLAEGSIEVDVDAFRRSAAQRDWEKVRRLYAGDFLEGFRVSGAQGFERWVDATRRSLRRTAVEGCLHSAERRLAEGDPRGALRAFREAVQVAPSDERAVRGLIELLLESGDEAGAATAYADLQRVLEAELGVEPSAATRRLVAERESRPEIRSLAVLPWANLTGRSDHDPLARGFADVLMTELARSYSGRVVSRQSTAGLEASAVSGPVVGRELGVDALIEGALSRFGRRLTVTVRLVGVEQERLLWADRVTASGDELPAAATRLARRLCQEALAAGRTSLVEAADPVPEASEHERDSGRLRLPTARLETDASRAAHAAYLKGRHYATVLREPGKAIASYREATRLAPGYAEAWSALAAAYATRTLLVAASPAELFDPFRDAARRGVALGPRLAEAHASMGLYHFLVERNWIAAEESLRRGAELADGSPEPLIYLALYLGAFGHVSEALDTVGLALDVDPVGPEALFVRAWILYKAGRLRESEAAFDEVLEYHPGSALARVHRSLTRALVGRPGGGADASTAIADAPDDVEVLALGAAALGLAGQADAAERHFQRLLGFQGQRYLDPWAPGVALAGMDRSEESLRWLQRMYDERSPSAFCIRCDPLLDALREHEAFRRIERRLGLPPLPREQVSPSARRDA